MALVSVVEKIDVPNPIAIGKSGAALSTYDIAPSLLIGCAFLTYYKIPHTDSNFNYKTILWRRYPLPPYARCPPGLQTTRFALSAVI